MRFALFQSLAAIVLLIGALNFAAADEKIGLELELSPRPLSALLKYFNIPQFEANLRQQDLFSKAASDDVFEDYVMNPAALASLPDPIRKELTEGLHLGSVLTNLERPEMKIYLGSGGNKPKPDMRPQQGGIYLSTDADLAKYTGTKIPPKSDLPSQSGQSGKIGQNGLVTSSNGSIGNPSSSRQELAPARNDWPILKTRWNALWKTLPRDQALQLIHLEYLSAPKVAEVITSTPVPEKRPDVLMGLLQLKSDAPAWIKKFIWSLDGVKGSRPVEFALAEPGTNPSESLGELEQMIKETGLERFFKNPMIHKEWDASVHIHLSGVPPENLRALAENYKRLTFVRVMAAGPHNDGTARPLLGEAAFGPGSENSYEVPLADTGMSQSKGLVRLVRGSNDHVELREPTKSPRETYQEFSRWAYLDPEEVDTEINSEIDEILKKDPQIAKRVLDINPTILLDFEKNLPSLHVRDLIEQEIVKDLKAGADPERSHQISKLFDTRPDFRTVQFLANLTDHFPDRELLPRFLLYRIKDPQAQEETRRYFEEHPELVRGGVVSMLLSWFPSDSALKSDLLPNLFKNTMNSPSEKQRAISLYYLSSMLDGEQSQGHKKELTETSIRILDFVQSLTANFHGNDEKAAAQGILARYRPGEMTLRQDEAKELVISHLKSKSDVFVTRSAIQAAVHLGVFPGVTLEDEQAVSLLTDALGSRHYDSMVHSYNPGSPKSIAAFEGFQKIWDIEDPEFFASLAKAFQSVDPSRREAAIDILAHLHPKDPESVAKWFENLRSNPLSPFSKEEWDNVLVGYCLEPEIMSQRLEGTPSSIFDEAFLKKYNKEPKDLMKNLLDKNLRTEDIAQIRALLAGPKTASDYALQELQHRDGPSFTGTLKVLEPASPYVTEFELTSGQAAKIRLLAALKDHPEWHEAILKSLVHGDVSPELWTNFPWNYRDSRERRILLDALVPKKSKESEPTRADDYTAKVREALDSQRGARILKEIDPSGYNRFLRTSRLLRCIRNQVTSTF